MNYSGPALLGFFLSILVTVSAAAAEPATVGVVLPLTGPVAEVGVGIKNAMSLAMKDRDQAGRVEFVFEDNQYDARSTVSAVQKLLTLKTLKGLVVFGSNPSMAIADMVERAEVPMVSIATAKEIVRGRKYIVRHHLNAEAEGELLANEVVREKYPSVAIVTTQNDGVLTIRDDLVRRLGGRVALNEEVAPSERELSPIASRIKKKDPPLTILCLMPPQAGILARRLKEIDYGGKLGGCHSVEVDPEAEKAGGSLVGSWFVGTDERTASEFFKEYQGAYGTRAPVVATNGYDIAVLFIEALSSGDPNQYLHTVRDFSGTLGKYGASADSSFDFKAAVKVVTPHGIEYK